jgi:hypothetical protein
MRCPGRVIAAKGPTPADPPEAALVVPHHRAVDGIAHLGVEPADDPGEFHW